jgi:hypothetical protein
MWRGILPPHLRLIFDDAVESFKDAMDGERYRRA